MRAIDKMAIITRADAIQFGRKLLKWLYQMVMKYLFFATNFQKNKKKFNNSKKKEQRFIFFEKATKKIYYA